LVYAAIPLLSAYKFVLLGRYGTVFVAVTAKWLSREQFHQLLFKSISITKYKLFCQKVIQILVSITSATRGKMQTQNTFLDETN